MTEYENMREQYSFNSERGMRLINRKQSLDRLLDKLDNDTTKAYEAKRNDRILLLNELKEICKELERVAASINHEANRALYCLENDIK